MTALVSKFTDDKALEKHVRKQYQIDSAQLKSDRAKLIKIADKTSNLRAILNSPPVNWNLARTRDYFEWASKVVSDCRGVNAKIEMMFDEIYDKGMIEFNQSK